MRALPIPRAGAQPLAPGAIEAIANAELIVLGPAGLYTSLLPKSVGAVTGSRRSGTPAGAPRLYISAT